MLILPIAKRKRYIKNSAIAAALMDPCTQAGMRKTVERLQGMTNPKTDRRYTLNEALDKTEKMYKLLNDLKAKIDAIKKLQGRS